MKYALIGCGRIATNHIKAVLNNGLELVAVCDILPEHMQALLEKQNFPQAFQRRFSECGIAGQEIMQLAHIARP